MSTFLTVQEVAKKLKVTVRAVQRWQQQGKISFIKIGGVVRIREEHFENWLDKHTIKAQKKIA